MDDHNRWKIKFSIIMVIAIIVIYGSNILILKDPEHVISYIWTHLGFIPVDILIVAFVLDEIIAKKEKEAMMEIKNTDISFKANVAPEDREEYLTNIRDLLINKREFIVGLINNPNLLEKEEFSGLLNAILHLDEELEHRPDLSKVSDIDFNHLNGDMQRVYNKLIHEWIYYLRYLNKHYPYMIALIIRTNPFDESADVYVKE